MKAIQFILLLFSVITVSAQVGIGTTTPNASSNLDVTSANKGILIPRVSIADATTAAPVASPLKSLLVYNTNAAIGEGFYYWNGTSWTKILAQADIDADWYGEGTTSAPTNINQSIFTHGDVGIGESNVNAKLDIRQATTARGIEMFMSNATTTQLGIGVFHSGLGRGGNVSLTNGSNADVGWAVFHSGSGTATYSSANNDAYVGFSGGIAGAVGRFTSTNALANNNSYGMIISYKGEATSGGAGGNTLEVQHNGTNGNAVEVFIGDPQSGAGPANTASNYSCISAYQMGTGASASAGNYKSAFKANVYGTDPSLIAFSNGDVARQGIMSYANPNANVDPEAVYGYSYTGARPGFGIGVKGLGGWYGVYGEHFGNNFAYTYGLYAAGDIGGTGAKSFIIDYPLDPENKALRHYSIESNEVLNMYRGTIRLDANGRATVDLPEYFDAVNIEPSYQLTAIGTPIQPYIAKEIANNQFEIAGAPNTKVSWTIHAKRNDPTIRYYDKNGKNYDDEVFVKPAKIKGKYYVPEAYNKPKNKGIDYSKQFEEQTKRGKIISEKKGSEPKQVKNLAAQKETKK